MTRGNSLIVLAGIFLFFTLIWLGPVVGSTGRRYEVKPEITLPEYKTDTARAIDACERMADRYGELIERYLTGLNGEVTNMVRKQDSVEEKLEAISIRLARIEKALGIEPQPRQTEETPVQKLKIPVQLSGSTGS